MHRLRVWGDADPPPSIYILDYLRDIHYSWVHDLFRSSGSTLSQIRGWSLGILIKPGNTVPRACTHCTAIPTGQYAINQQCCLDSRTSASLLWDLQNLLSPLPNQLWKCFYCGGGCKWILLLHFFLVLLDHTLNITWSLNTFHLFWRI